MIKRYEVENMIINALEELDGHMSDKPDEDGNYDLYFVVTNDYDDYIIVDFQTCHGGDLKNMSHDKYKIKVEYVD